MLRTDLADGILVFLVGAESVGKCLVLSTNAPRKPGAQWQPKHGYCVCYVYPRGESEIRTHKNLSDALRDFVERLDALEKDDSGPIMKYTVADADGNAVKKHFEYTDEGLLEAYALAEKEGFAVWESFDSQPRYLLKDI